MFLFLCGVVVALASSADALLPPEGQCRRLVSLSPHASDPFECVAAHYAQRQHTPVYANVSGSLATFDGGVLELDPLLENLHRGCVPGSTRGGGRVVSLLSGPSIALVRRGGCSFSRKAAYAVAAGFTGLVIVDNDGAPFITPPQLTDDTVFPVVMVSFATGRGIVERWFEEGAVRVELVLGSPFDPTDASSLFSKGWALWRLARHEGGGTETYLAAERALRRSVALDNKFASSSYLLAEVLYALGRSPSELREVLLPVVPRAREMEATLLRSERDQRRLLSEEMCRLDAWVDRRRRGGARPLAFRWIGHKSSDRRLLFDSSIAALPWACREDDGVVTALTSLVDLDVAPDGNSAAAVAGGEQRERKLGGPTGVHVVAVATDMRPELEALNQSATLAGMTLEVLGMGLEYEMGLKFRLTAEYLPTLPRDLLVLFVDAYDVLIAPVAADALVRRFHAFNASVVIGSEIDCWPDRAAAALYPFEYPYLVNNTSAAREEEAAPFPHSRPPFPYLNSGSYMGAAGDLSNLLYDISRDMAEYHTYTGAEAMFADDQRWLMRQLFRRPNDITLDFHGQLFQALHGIGSHSLLSETGELDQLRLVFSAPPGTRDGNDMGEEEEEEAGGPVFVWSDFAQTAPCVVHGNGAGKAAYNELVRLGASPEMAWLDDTLSLDSLASK